MWDVGRWEITPVSIPVLLIYEAVYRVKGL